MDHKGNEDILKDSKPEFILTVDNDIGGLSSVKKHTRNSAAGIATGCGLDDRGVGARVLVESRILSSPCCPDQLWSPPNHLSNEYWGLFPRD
jgi:hypothetical protein